MDPPQEDNSTIWVGSIPAAGANIQKIQQLFSRFGDVIQITIRNKEADRSWAFVTYSDQDGAHRAIQDCEERHWTETHPEEPTGSDFPHVNARGHNSSVPDFAPVHVRPTALQYNVKLANTVEEHAKGRGFGALDVVTSDHNVAVDVGNQYFQNWERPRHHDVGVDRRSSLSPPNRHHFPMANTRRAETAPHGSRKKNWRPQRKGAAVSSTSRTYICISVLDNVANITPDGLQYLQYLQYPVG